MKKVLASRPITRELGSKSATNISAVTVLARGRPVIYVPIKHAVNVKNAMNPPVNVWQTLIKMETRVVQTVVPFARMVPVNLV